jgi:hypothetical protein
MVRLPIKGSTSIDSACSVYYLVHMRAFGCFVTIANSWVWKTVTGENPPATPPTAADYSKAGLPWFDYYDADAQVLSGSAALAGVKSVLDLGIGKGTTPLPENESAEVRRLVHVKQSPRTQVREMPLS